MTLKNNAANNSITAHLGAMNPYASAPYMLIWCCQ